MQKYLSPCAELIALQASDVIQNSWKVGEYDESENVFDYNDLNNGKNP